MERGVEDRFGHSGPVETLMEWYGLTAEKLMEKVRACPCGKITGESEYGICDDKRDASEGVPGRVCDRGI